MEPKQRKGKTQRVYTDSEKATIRELYTSGKNAREIADTLGRGYTGVRLMIWRMGREGSLYA